MTDDDRMDTLLREWGAQARENAPSVRPAAHRTRSRWPAALSVAALVVALTGAVLLVRGTHHAALPVLGGATTETATTQQVTYGHLAIRVPKSWPLDDVDCSTPKSDTVIVITVFFACRAIQVPNVTWVQFSQSGHAQPLVGGTSRDMGVGGHEATVVTGRTQDGVAALTVDVPDAHASVLIAAPSRPIIDRLAATLSYVDVDSVGCAVDATYAPLRSTPAPTIPAAEHELVPGKPVSLVVCGYSRDVLLHGSAVPPGALASDLEVLRALPSGLSRAASGQGMCAGTGAAALDVGDDAVWFELHVGYASGPSLELHVRIGSCGDLGVSNGARTGQRTQGLLDLLTPTHVEFGYPEYVKPAPGR